MRTVRTVSELRDALAAPRRRGERIGLVPTMGALHAGHLSLIRRAREECEHVVVSLFVNPTQFNESSDLEAYPRDEQRDATLAAELGIDLLLAPPAEEIYPSGFATTVSVAGITDGLEGAVRGREHFDGVVTVVTKLFNMVSPDVAYLGQKDAQQALVIKRLVRDLDMPVQIEVCETVREPDGLAMSSRNVHLDREQRKRAAALPRALRAAASAVEAGVESPAEVLRLARAELDAAGIELEYLELVSAETLTPVERIEGQVLALLAARVGTTRLIDNQVLEPHTARTSNQQPLAATAGATHTRRN